MVDKDSVPVGIGEVGELVIGGVGLARYLDPDKDAEKYAEMPTLGWSRAYRSGDLVRLEPDGLYFVGRADDQVKVGGRRIELGEVDAALVNLPGVSGGAAAVRRTASGTPLLVGYVASADPTFDIAGARTALAETLPAALVPRLVLVDELPTRTSGKVDRDALPWPPPGKSAEEEPDLGGTMGWLAGLWRDVLAAPVDGPEADFHVLGGGSLSAAQLVAAMRQRYPQVTVADLYDHPRLGSLAGYLDELDPPPAVETRVVKPTPRLTQAVQVALSLPLATLTGLQWVVWLALLNNVVAQLRPMPWLVPVNWWWIAVGFLLFITPLGRMSIAALSARILLGGLEPGTYRRGGPVHLRVWAAERLGEASGAENQAGAPWLVYYARMLGNKVGKGVDLHSDPARDRDAEAGASLLHRTRGRPVGALDRRRPLPRRPDHRRQRRHHRGAHHAVARCCRGQERRRRARLRRGQQGQERAVLEGLARGEVRQGPASVAGPPSAAGTHMGGDLRRDVDPVGRGSPGGAGRWPGHHRLGRTRCRFAHRGDRTRRAVDTRGDTGRGADVCRVDGDRGAGAVTVDA